MAGGGDDLNRPRAGFFGHFGEQCPEHGARLGNGPETDAAGISQSLEQGIGPVAFARVKTLRGCGIGKFVGDFAAQPVIEQDPGW